MKRMLRLVSVLMMAFVAAALLGGCTSDNGAVEPRPEEPGPGQAQSSAPQTPVEKIHITTLDELPQHTYPFTGQVVELVESEAQVRELAAKVRADIAGDLEKYEIGDHATLQRMYSTLLTIDLLEGNYDEALERVEQIRALEDKPAQRLVTGLFAQSMITARRETGAAEMTPAYRQAFRRHLAAKVSRLPWDVVQDEIQQGKGQMELFSENLLIGIVQAQMQPVVDQTGELNADQAGGVLGMHLMLAERLPLKDEIIAVYQEKIDANQETKADIWAERAVTLAPNKGFKPVLVAAWDSGTDTAVFEQALFVNPDEVEDGRDTDGNGYVDDVHGIAYDIHAERTSGMLCPLEGAAERMPRVMEHIKGLMDLQAAIDSPEATALKQHLASLDPADVKGFMEDLGLAGNFSHGTHVAGIMLAGNPYARLLIARLSYDHRTVPVARTLEWGRRDAAKCRDTVEYFKQQHVRVVNMSWGEAQEDAEASLEANGIGDNAAERRELARQVFALQKEGLYEAIKGAPEILFVCAAGNADSDVEFDQYIASSFDLPNLLVVGAVDQAGDPTSFTSFGRTVQVYANGFEVDSYVPGGQRMKMSGTSMASPNVANLAAKLLAINPKLTPEMVIHLIKQGADQQTDGSRSYLLINPQRSVELAYKRMRS